MAMSSTIPTPTTGSPGPGGFLVTLAIALIIMLAGIVVSVVCAVAVFAALNAVLPDIKLVQAVLVMLLGVAACFGYFWGSNRILDTIYPARGVHIADNINKANGIRPWLFLGPAVVILGIYLVYPVVNSIFLSFHGPDGRQWVGGANYAWLATDAAFRESMFNNILWLLVVPAAATFFGLIAAALTDRIGWGNLAKSLIFMPMAISFVGASVIWKFIYDYRAEGTEQIGLLNAIVTFFGGEPQAWITLPLWNSFFLMVILIWIQTGFAMVILSAALRGIPEETIEAAIIDGASPFQIFYKIKVPQIWATIAVVWTTITILVLKVFDIVLAMTNGQWGSQVLANYMFDWMFRGLDFGRASTIALVIMAMVTPIMIWNIREARKDMK
ncbi:binding-protein-dependent transport system inner membrane protein [Nitratireductor pacificus pht-3B]|uniref:Binding-protein-dependent transport system inner membrane protein n=2 Tax=Nitratireductor TaxID=245876 RepID=K2N1K8_9HYPH|nr:binding-protein-dependent transport system inner membrane protein [Nitratireductor pacificus pht-3B]